MSDDTPNGDDDLILTNPAPGPPVSDSPVTVATLGGASVYAAGAPTSWLWNEFLAWIFPGLPVMPDDVAIFFGGVLLAIGYGVSRLMRRRATPVP